MPAAPHPCLDRGEFERLPGCWAALLRPGAAPTEVHGGLAGWGVPGSHVVRHLVRCLDSERRRSRP